MELELKSILQILWRWSWLLVASTIVAAAISYSATSQMPRIYSATTTLMVGQVLQATNPNASDFSTTQQLAQTYVQLVRRQPLLQATVESLGLNVPWQALGGQVSAGALPNTQLMQITVVDSSPSRAKIITDEVAHQLILQSPTPSEKEQNQRQGFLDQQLSDLQGRIDDAQKQIKDLQLQLANETGARNVLDVQNQVDALQQKVATWQSTYANLMTSKVGRTNNLSVVEPATGSSVPISPNAQLNVMAASAVGFALALAAILLIEYLDDTLKTVEEAARALKLPYLGGLADMGQVQSLEQRLVALTEPRSPAAEAFRVLSTSIQLALRSKSKTRLLVTSAGIGEGKTTIAANLAVSLAQAGKTVILCDLDLRRPSIHRLFGLRNELGLSGLVLDPSLPLEVVLQPTAQPGLWVLGSGSIPANAVELLTAEALEDRLGELAQHADVLVFDSPGVMRVADAQIIASFASAIVLVADARHTRRDDARQALAVLEKAGVPILGVALNRAKDLHTFYTYRDERQPRRFRSWLRRPALLGGVTGLHR